MNEMLDLMKQAQRMRGEMRKAQKETRIPGSGGRIGRRHGEGRHDVHAQCTAIGN